MVELSRQLVAIVINQLPVIRFEKSAYEVPEGISQDDLALLVCLNIFNLSSKRTIRVSVVSGTAQGELVTAYSCFNHAKLMSRQRGL